MLHYNYSTSLSHFLSYHQFDDAPADSDQTSTCGDDDRKSGNTNSSNPQNKSFTIAAILGLKGDHHQLNSSHLNHNLQLNQLNQLNHSLSHNLSHSRLGTRGVMDDEESVVNLSVLHQNSGNGGATAGGGGGGGGGGGSGGGLNGRQVPSVRSLAGHFGGGHPNRHTVRGLKLSSTSGSTSTTTSSLVVVGKKSSSKSKRVRTIFTPEQLERLEAEFERQQYMVGPERLYLAHTLQLTEAQVKVWFQNRRIKWRKHHLELTHQRLAVLKQQQILMEEAHVPDHLQDTTSSSSEI